MFYFLFFSFPVLIFCKRTILTFVCKQAANRGDGEGESKGGGEEAKEAEEEGVDSGWGNPEPEVSGHRPFAAVKDHVIV